jgi:hypothetical protein
MHVIERGACVLERRRTVDAAPATIAHRGQLERSLVFGRKKTYAAQKTSRGAWRTRCAGKRDAMTVSSGQSHLAGKDDTPLREEVPRAGCRESKSVSESNR